MALKISYFMLDGKCKTHEHAQCFADLRNNNHEVKLIHYYLNTKVSSKLKDWWFSTIKQWGFEFEYGADNLLIVKLESFLERTIVLMLLRYLDATDDLVRIIARTKKWSILYPNFDVFKLFQLSHVVTFREAFYNTNHTIFPQYSQQLLDLENFKNRVGKKKDQKWKYGIVTETSQSEFINSQEIVNAILEKDVPILIKLLS